jgi:hypothetical protein
MSTSALLVSSGEEGATLGTFFFSLWGLHKQMVAAKEDELALARRLDAEAYEPVREGGTLDALEEQHSRLGVADSLEKRANAIHERPSTKERGLGHRPGHERRCHHVRPREVGVEGDLLQTTDADGGACLGL